MPRAKPGGYIDNAALARARRAVDPTIVDVKLLLQEVDRMSPVRRTQVLARLALRIADMSAALAEMERIRRER